MSATNSDADEIRELLVAYCWHMDRGEFDALRTLFAHPLRSDRTASYHQAETADNVAELHRKLCIIYDDGTARTKYVCTNAIVELDADGQQATSRSYFLVEQQLDDFPLQPIMAGRYHDDFERVDGRWRFTARRTFVDLIGDLHRHRRMIIG